MWPSCGHFITFNHWYEDGGLKSSAAFVAFITVLGFSLLISGVLKAARRNLLLIHLLISLLTVKTIKCQKTFKNSSKSFPRVQLDVCKTVQNPKKSTPQNVYQLMT